VTGLLLAKLVTTPLLMALVTWAARRLGPTASGILVGLPLTSGPVLVFLFLQEGPAFAARAAVGTLLGLISVTAFSVGYGFASARSPWPVALAVGVVAYGISTWDLRRLSPAPVQALGVVLLVLLLSLVALPDPGAVGRPVMPSGALPLRMVVATAVVVSVTALAQALGPELSGLLAPIPVFTAIVAVLSHRSGGRTVVVKTLRGVIVGNLGCAAFFAVVASELGRRPAGVVFLAASLAGLVLAGLSFLVMRRREERPGDAPPSGGSVGSV